ncbi:1-acyl-sn-glycerol-3-phosphate acyltransferase beta-like isoform X2 [Apis laboriosa]|uniref:1-acyl-sn-glycerol-3-phosphate acyltransferase beta-like isoform X2 n=1 Tax=Apis laboriosa TaxID=183418 RepID=UPI001CC45A7E|nr:1-acyl-sn-glycerol-3-phosphate acyltransferase beta-like isoform X2 [Apis laboriosa]XP_043801508.1 1-acyl-sn-glycerol-3-phosphate acyltransferase beta-like isoform X2 [Apis laboriosa]
MILCIFIIYFKFRTVALVFAPITKAMGVSWEIRGREHLEQERSCIVIMNHQSLLDCVGLYQIWPFLKKSTIISRRIIFYIWPSGLICWFGKVIFINRMKSNLARKILNDATDYIKEKKMKLLIFPEGTRRNNGEIHAFKKGAFYIAIRNQLPIIPVVFSSYYNFLSNEEKRFDSGRVIVEALPAISTEGLTLDDINKLLEKTRNSMIDTFEKINKEVQVKCF